MKKIYLILQGRIGNQLFQYALARKLQKKCNDNRKIVIDDSRVIKCGWENSLINYNLPDVEYVHDNVVSMKKIFTKNFILRTMYKILTHNSNFIKKYEIEKKMNKFTRKFGAFFCENGYIEPQINTNKNIYLEGYFQSEKYFDKEKEEIKELFSSKQFSQVEQYKDIENLRTRNSVCISVKIEHNVGSSLYDVCGIEYWKKAIEYIIKKVEKPLFFICSDNVEYVLEHLIDANKFDYVIQDKKMPVHVTLAAMSQCKHFIIGNTTFGWWAQYLSNNNDKIVVAPSRWMAVDMPIDIYQENWSLIDV